MGGESEAAVVQPVRCRAAVQVQSGIAAGHYLNV
jgi:hypothetical protein